MQDRLGYDRWVAQGGDWGSAITHAMASQRRGVLLAAHVNLPWSSRDAPGAANQARAGGAGRS